MKLNWNTLHALSNWVGNSYYILDADKFRCNFSNLHSAFEAEIQNVKIAYSYKTNYIPDLCYIIQEEGGYAEVVSDMEFRLAQRIGVEGSRIVFNGPVKVSSTIRDAALSGAILNLDNMRDVKVLVDLSQTHSNKQISAVIRCNFDLCDGSSSRFGFDVTGGDIIHAVKLLTSCKNINLKGLHCHFPQRDLLSFERRAHELTVVVRRFFPNKAPELINIGGGFFGNLPECMTKGLPHPVPDFQDYAAVIGKTLKKGLSGYGKLPTLFLEPGTTLAADTLSFISKVMHIKKLVSAASLPSQVACLTSAQRRKSAIFQHQLFIGKSRPLTKMRRFMTLLVPLALKMIF